MSKKQQNTPPRWLTTRKLVLFALALATGLILLFLLRYPLITVYANVFYKPGVAKQFDQTFAPLRAKLQEFGFAFTGQPPSYN